MSQTKAWLRYLELIKERPECFQDNGPIHIVKDWETVEKYQSRTGKTIGVCYESEFNVLVVDLVYEQAGEYFTYERILPSVLKGAVVCVTKYKNEYVLLKQYRHAIRDYQYAFPRGYALEGCTGEQNACKEIKEELGASVKTVQYMGAVVADSGLSGQLVQVYFCEIDGFQKQNGYEGIVDVCVVSEKEFKDMICRNQILDGFTLAAYSQTLIRMEMSFDQNR